MLVLGEIGTCVPLLSRLGVSIVPQVPTLPPSDENLINIIISKIYTKQIFLLDI